MVNTRCDGVLTWRVVTADYSNPHHSAEISRLVDAYAHDPMGGGESLPEAILETLVSRLSQVPNAFSLLAFCGEAPDEPAVGLVNCFQSFSTFFGKNVVNIHDIYVVPFYRGQGLGHRLLIEVERIALMRDCCKITLEVLEGNHAAQRVYTQAGFKPYALNPKMGQAVFWNKLL